MRVFMKYDLSSFQDNLKELHIELSDHQMEQFITYYEMLVETNKVMNLTSITEFDEVIKKHFVDSLCLVKAFDNGAAYFDENRKVIDIGTGAGFPGIPLKIAFPKLEITLLDSLNKRVGFLQNVISTLQLDGIEAVHGRAEDFAKPEMLREKFDLCVSRAVANLSTLSEYCIPYVKVGGKFISYKSEKLDEELKSAEHAIQTLGGQVIQQVDFILPGSNIYRNLCVIEKKEVTPAKYPRKAGSPLKKPL